MKKTIIIFKVIGIVICSILIISFLFVVINSKFGNSKINTEIDGFGTTLLAVNSNSIDRTEHHFKFAFCFNDKINIKIPLHKTSEVTIKPVAETIRRKMFRSKNIGFHLDQTVRL